MTGWSILTAVLVALIAALILMIAATALGRLVRRSRQRRHERIRASIRPAIVAVLAETDTEVPLDIPTGRSAADLFEVLAYDYLAKVRGESRDALVKVLVDRGAVTAAERRVGRPGVVGKLGAIELLGRCGLARSRPSLEGPLGHRNPDVRAAAARALGRLGDTAAIPALLASTHQGRTVPAAIVAQAVVRIGPAGAPALLAALDDPQDAVRAVAATVLGLQQAVVAVPALCDVVANDPDTAVRQRAIRSLGIIADPRGLDCLIAAAREPLLAAHAAEALGHLGARAGLPTLLTLIGDEHHDVALAAAGALAECGAPGVEALIDLQRTGGPGARYATATLARLGLERGEAPVVEDAVVPG